MFALILSFFVSYNANAYNDTKFTPASIQGYTTYGYASQIGTNEDIPSYSKYGQNEDIEIITEVRDAKVKQIQQRYQEEGVQNLADDIEMPFDTDDTTDNAKMYHKNTRTTAHPEDITDDAFAQICSDMGYTKDTERNALDFHECITYSMKTKLTEEENNKTQYNQIDTNIVKALEFNTLRDKTIESLVPYEEMITQRNKIDCIAQKDYHKCTKTITAYKQCYNKAVDFTQVEHNKNKITCYTKTGLRFPDPDAKEEYVRDAYFGMCIHLVEKDLRATFIKDNAECNKILTKNGLLNLAI